MKVGSKVLGLAIGQKNILVAEVVTRGDRHAVNHFADFVFPEGMTLGTPEKLGEEFGKFLRSKKFSAKDAIIGLPAKRLLTRRKEVPPATPAVAASVLRVQAEGAFSSELENLVTDYAGTPNATEATTVLLVATKQVVLDECQAMARAAGIRIQAITSTTAALGRATSRLPGGDGLVLSLGSGSAELVIQHGLDPAHLRHLNVGGGAAPEVLGALAGEIRRMMAAIPTNGTPQTLALWSSGEENPQKVLEQRLSMPVTVPQLNTLVATDTPGMNGYAPAVAVGLLAFEPNGLPVDFLNSRLAPPKEAAISTPKAMALMLGVIILGVGVWAFMDYSAVSTRLTSINAQIAKLKPDADTAKANLKRYDDADKWIPDGARYVAVLRDMTQLFPNRPNTIWATNLLNERGTDKWELTGQAYTEQDAQLLRDAMLTDKRFAQANLGKLTVDKDNLIRFQLKFVYNGSE